MRKARLVRIMPIKWSVEDYEHLRDEAWAKRISLSQLVRDAVFAKYKPL